MNLQTEFTKFFTDTHFMYVILTRIVCVVTQYVRTLRAAALLVLQYCCVGLFHGQGVYVYTLCNIYLLHVGDCSYLFISLTAT
jgi:hypothetical protein